VPLPAHREPVPLRNSLQRAVHGFQKIVAVRLNVKSDQVRPQQPVHELTLPGANAKHFRVRPRNVPENRDARIGPRLLYHPREQCEVIILRQQNRRFRPLHFLQDRVGKPPVDFLILQPVFRPENRPRMRDVAERPQPFVRKSLVVAFIFFIAEPHAAQRVTRMIRRDSQPVVRINNFAVRVS